MPLTRDGGRREASTASCSPAQSALDKPSRPAQVRGLTVLSVIVSVAPFADVFLSRLASDSRSLILLTGGGHVRAELESGLIQDDHRNHNLQQQTAAISAQSMVLRGTSMNSPTRSCASARLIERLCKQGVTGSSPVGSTPSQRRFGHHSEAPIWHAAAADLQQRILVYLPDTPCLNSMCDRTGSAGIRRGLFLNPCFYAGDCCCRGGDTIGIGFDSCAESPWSVAWMLRTANPVARRTARISRRRA